MATIYTRATKGSALTWTEGDANITNLNNDKIEDIVEDTTPQLGGDLDVNGNKIVSASNGNIALEPNGTGKVTANKNIETTADVKGKELYSTNSTGDEGGQINLAKPATNSTISGTGVIVDVYQNKLRIFEEGGSARGAYIDLTAAGASVSSDLLAGGGGASTLNDLTDVTISSPGADQILKYDTLTSQWINAAPSTPSIALDGLSDVTTTTPSNGQALIYNGSTFQWENQTISSGGISNVVEDTTPQLGGSLDVNGQSIVSTSNGNIVLEPNGTGDVQLNADTVRVGDLNSAAFITTNGTGSLLLSTNNGTNSGTITINQGANANIFLTPNGTGQSVISNLEYNEYIHSLGTTSGTVAPNVANGNVQTITLNGNLTLNAFTSPVAGQSLTLIVTTGGTGRTLSSTMKWAGADKTLSTTSTTDIISVFYDGTNYWASLSKGFA
jgi:hypothetical protein